MANTIDTAFISQFSDNVIHAAQQKGSKLRSLVRLEDVRGEDAYFDVIGQTHASAVSAQHADSLIADVPHSRRKVTLSPYAWGEMVDHFDKAKMLLDPVSNYILAAGAAMGRAMDEVIVDALLGSAATGKTGGTSVALPSGQKVAVDLEVAATNTNLTIAKLLQAKYILDAADVDPELPRYFVCTANQKMALLKATEIKSSDYNTVKALANGDVNTFLGFNFIEINGKRTGGTNPILPKSSNIRKNIAFVGGPLGGALLGVGMEPVAKVGERADKQFNYQIHFNMLLGATRLQEEMVVEVSVDETK